MDLRKALQDAKDEIEKGTKKRDELLEKAKYHRGEMNRICKEAEDCLVAEVYDTEEEAILIHVEAIVSKELDKLIKEIK